MHIIPSADAKVRLIYRDGSSQTYRDIDELGAAFAEGFRHPFDGQRLLELIVTSFKTKHWNDGFVSGFHPIGSYRVEDMGCEAVAPERIVQAWRQAIKRKRKTKWRPQGQFRNGPWPNIRHHHGHYAWCRHMRTMQELRLHTADDEAILEAGWHPDQVCRAKRKALPTAWDDQYRHSERNWKRQRLTRWRF